MHLFVFFSEFARNFRPVRGRKVRACLFAPEEYLKIVLRPTMTTDVSRHRVIMHVEGRNNHDEPITAYAQTADFEKVLTTELCGHVTRLQLVQRICGWICNEALLHEHSDEVAMMIQNTVQEGVVQAAAPGTKACLVGRDTSPDMWLKVDHELVMGGVALAMGSLVVGVDNACLETSVPALRIVCALDNDTFVISTHLTPVMALGSYSECHCQKDCQCTAVRVGAPLGPAYSGPFRAQSHRNRRLQSQAEHKRDVLAYATEHATADVGTSDVGLIQKVLSRKVTIMTSPAGQDGLGAIHTVFFR